MITYARSFDGSVAAEFGDFGLGEGFNDNIFCTARMDSDGGSPGVDNFDLMLVTHSFVVGFAKEDAAARFTAAGQREWV